MIDVAKPMLHKPQRIRRNWSFAIIIGVSTLLLVTIAMGIGAGVAARLAWIANTQDDDAASVIVRATDGQNTLVWLERDGRKGRVYSSTFRTAPGAVTMRITRRTAGDQVRSDIVHMTLRAGCQNLVVVGDDPINARVHLQGGDVISTAVYFPPGALDIDLAQRQLLVDPPNSSPRFRPVSANDSLEFATSDRRADGGKISAKDHVLLIANPFSDVIECSVTGNGWEHTISLPGPACRVVAIGNSKSLHLVARLAPDQRVIEDRTFDVPDGLSLYTVGGRTMYRWTALQPDKPAETVDDKPAIPAPSPSQIDAPPVPRGWFTELPADVTVRITHGDAASRWLIDIDDWNGTAIGLTPIINTSPLFAPTPLAALSIYRDIKVSEITVTGTSAHNPVTSVATDGAALIGIIDSSACDLATGQPLHDPGASPVIRAAMGRFGLILMTGDGRLSVIRHHQLVSRQAFDPTMHIVPAHADAPAVWLFGGAISDQLTFQSLESVQPQNFPIPGITALAPADDDLLIARGRRIDRISRHTDSSDPEWKARPVAILPDNPNEPIIGLLDLNGRLVFSTAQSIFTVQNDMVLPLIDGLGGTLYSYRGGVLVHDAKSLRLFQLTGGSLGAPSPNLEAAQ